MITLHPTRDKDGRCNLCGTDKDIYELNLKGIVIAICPKCSMNLSELLLKIPRDILELYSQQQEGNQHG